MFNRNTVSTRVSDRVRDAIDRRAREIGSDRGTLIRTALLSLLDRDPDAAARLLVSRGKFTSDAKLADLLTLLGLKPDASSTDVLAAVQALLGDDQPPPAPGGDVTAGNADPPAPASPISGKLTRAELAYCERHKLTPSEFARRKAGAARRTGTSPRSASARAPVSGAPRMLTRAELAYCERHKLTPAEFDARKRASVRKG